MPETGEARQDFAVLPFGIAAIDRHLPAYGLSLGCLHEVAAAGPEMEHGAAAPSRASQFFW